MEQEIKLTRDNLEGYIQLQFRRGKEYLSLTLVPKKGALYLYNITGANAGHLISAARKELTKIANEKNVRHITTDVIENKRLEELAQRLGFKKSRIRTRLLMPYGGGTEVLTYRKITPMKMKLPR